MIKAIVCDLDGTLLGPNHQISDYTRATIAQVKEKGIEVYIATGRHHLDADAYRTILGLDTYLISSNGAKVHDGRHNEVISYNIDAATAAQVLDMAVHDDIRFNVYQNDLWFADRTSKMLADFYSDSGFQCTIQDLSTLKGKEVTKFFFVVDTHDLVELNALERRLRQHLGQQLTITYSLSHCLEVLQYGVSKGRAIQELLFNQHIRPEEVIAFGDGMNDVEMLSIVGTGLVMGNADALKRALPQHQVIGTNAEDGLAKYLQQHVLNS